MYIQNKANRATVTHLLGSQKMLESFHGLCQPSRLSLCARQLRPHDGGLVCHLFFSLARFNQRLKHERNESK